MLVNRKEQSLVSNRSNFESQLHYHLLRDFDEVILFHLLSIILTLNVECELQSLCLTKLSDHGELYYHNIIKWPSSLNIKKQECKDTASQIQINWLSPCNKSLPHLHAVLSPVYSQFLPSFSLSTLRLYS